MRLNFYEDPGHGWLAVPLQLLEQLQLLDSISTYSYMRGMLAHLEEDDDYARFALAMRDAGRVFAIREHHTDKHSRIRNYDPYSPERARRNLANNRSA